MTHRRDSLSASSSDEAAPEESDSPAPAPRRHRPASSLVVGGQRLPTTSPPSSTSVTTPPTSFVVPRDVFRTSPDLGMTDERPHSLIGEVSLKYELTTRTHVSTALRALFGDPAQAGGTLEGVALRWTALTSHDDLDRWIDSAEPREVFLLIQHVHDSAAEEIATRVAQQLNTALERDLGDHRFVRDKLVPITSRADAVALEQAVRAAALSGLSRSSESLIRALELMTPIQASYRAAAQEGARAAAAAAHVLTGEHYLSLEDAIADLDERRMLDGRLDAQAVRLCSHASAATARTTADDARVILMMCAGLVAQLARRLRSSQS